MECIIEGCSNSRGGKQRHCYACKAGIERYGLTTVDRQKLLSQQGGKCKLCDKDIAFTNTKRHVSESAVVDHDHETGKVRGVLCIRCNNLVGQIDNGVSLDRIKEYRMVAQPG